MAFIHRALGMSTRGRLPSLAVAQRPGGPPTATCFGGKLQLGRQGWQATLSIGSSRFCSTGGTEKKIDNIVEVDYHELQKLTPETIALLRKAFVGPKAFGAVAVKNIPGYGDKLKKAFRHGIDLALTDPAGRARAAAVNNTYPGWSGNPGEETHPLQSSFLFNTKEEIPGGKVDPYFGKNVFPSEDYRQAFRSLTTPMHDAALDVLRGCDVIIQEDMEREGLDWAGSGRSLYRLAAEGPALASRFICYDSGFTREDNLLENRDNSSSPGCSVNDAQPKPLIISHADEAAGGKVAGHASDGLASMRTHSTPVKTAGHAGDGLASMRTHSTPVKTAGHAGDGLASMRTHSTPVKTAGHAGDGLASMRTHSTPVKTAGHAGDGLASMRTHSTPVKTAGHAGDGLASMRTHSTPVKTAGHAGDGLASMRTHSTPVKTAGHAGDGLASMRTHSTPVKTAGHAGDGLASMRTHSTPVKTAGHAGDGLASMRTHSTPVKSSGSAGAPDRPASLLSHVSAAKGSTTSAAVRPHSTQTMTTGQGQAGVGPGLPAAFEAEAVEEAATKEKDAGEYWLPWHIDSNFLTVLHKEVYASEKTAELVPDPEGAGLMIMTGDGDVAMLETSPDVMILQMGAFAQIYAGGQVNACRHAVLSPRPAGTARFNFCNFWYVPWDTLCDTLPGRQSNAISTGWNAMMDSSYLNITMRQGFAAFRKFMTSPEARIQFADTVRFKELSELFPLPTKAKSATGSATEIVVDILTDVRCPFSFLSQLNLETALKRLNLGDLATIRYHPVFLNPNVPAEGENLDDYLLREYGYSKEYAHSDEYPLRVAGLEAGVLLNPNRRVVNTFDAFVLLDAAREQGKEHEVVKAMSRRYFENAEDISSEEVLVACAVDAGLPAEEASLWLSDLGRRARVKSVYDDLAQRVGEVPHFVLRERASGNGVEVGGNRSPEAWIEALEEVLQKANFVGMSVPGPYGKTVRLTEANPTAPVSMAVAAQHSWTPGAWPFTAEHFSRIDESPDTAMYAAPRLVHHLDASSLARLTEVYRGVFDAAPRGFAVLDLCSSWASHFPEEAIQGARVCVHGLNEKELEANQQATERHVQDLNADARLPWADASFDFVTMALSVQYLTNPRAVFAEMNRVLKPGGMAVVAHSHRCFIEKAVKVFADETDDGEGHTHVVCRYFQHGPEAGWEKLATADVSPRHGDPVWLVTATKAGFSEQEEKRD